MNSNIFIQENALKNGICEMGGIHFVSASMR